jgi:hypothetical protein
MVNRVEMEVPQAVDFLTVQPPTLVVAPVELKIS